MYKRLKQNRFEECQSIKNSYEEQQFLVVDLTCFSILSLKFLHFSSICYYSKFLLE